ncbi:nitroreductase family protein [Micromonospora sp. WMMD882]|uniref:nitroreductase family protein n=1 Tax=Micromonospora sp. WMMD882 TaxID=3015151 RepID=UPI00248BB3EA|nr:nitroreductase family protein [Micromonospora sp. WMMD882]WBB80673.1 nitroreductase family protein [Micromonospora sp. WMMD882]
MADWLTPDELLTTTRAVRRRLDLTRPVPRELIEECLRVAQQAPCGSGRHVLHWVVVTEPRTRARLGEIYRAAFADQHGSGAGGGSDNGGGADGGPTDGVAGTEAGRGAAPAGVRAGSAAQRSLASAVWLAEHLGQVPVLLLACVVTPEPLPQGNQAGLWGSVLPGVWSFMLAARARGLGTAWTTAHLRREAEVARLLGIPAGTHQVALVPTAFHRGDTFRPATRPPLADVLHDQRW